MKNIETIVAISTPPGRGGIGIVRLSGSEARAIAVQLVALKSVLEHARARVGWIVDARVESSVEKTEKIDEAVVTFFAAPNSYTGEDLVEIAAHGSPVVLNFLLARAMKVGARLAEPGEFTERAFLSGRIDLTQAEAVRDLIEAKTLAQARQAASQLGGALSHRVQPTKQGLLNLIALLEAGIDFAEDDIDVAPQGRIAAELGALLPPLEALGQSYQRGRVLHDGLTMAIVGRPNAGKSSLFNRLAERERAIVTAIPGTTRDLVTERVEIGGIPIELVDTAGVREALEEVERIGIARTHEALADASIVLVVLDDSEELNADEERLLELVAVRAAIVVRNKADLKRQRAGGRGQGSEKQEQFSEIRDQRSAQLQPTDSLKVVETSALTGEGVEELRGAILELATGGAAAEPGALTTLRHRQAVEETIAALKKAELANAESIPHEMLLLDLYEALAGLDALTGQTTNDDVLERIFTTFCIGK